MYYDYTTYFRQIIALLTDVNNNLVSVMGQTSNLLKIAILGLFLGVSLWTLGRSWRYRK